MDAGTKPSTRFWCGQSTNQRLSTMTMPIQVPMPMVPAPLRNSARRQPAAPQQHGQAAASVTSEA